MSNSSEANDRLIRRATLTFFAVTLLSCVPCAWLLTLTPMHDGSDFLSSATCLLAAGASLLLGGIAGLFVRFRNLSPPSSEDEG
jgi:hypothetical protein